MGVKHHKSKVIFLVEVFQDGLQRLTGLQTSTRFLVKAMKWHMADLSSKQTPHLLHLYPIHRSTPVYHKHHILGDSGQMRWSKEVHKVPIHNLMGKELTRPKSEVTRVQSQNSSWFINFDGNERNLFFCASYRPEPLPDSPLASHRI